MFRIVLATVGIVIPLSLNAADVNVVVPPLQSRAVIDANRCLRSDVLAPLTPVPCDKNLVVADIGMPREISKTKLTPTEIYDRYADAVILVKATWKAEATREDIDKLPPDQQQETLKILNGQQPVILNIIATDA